MEIAVVSSLSLSYRLVRLTPTYNQRTRTFPPLARRSSSSGNSATMNPPVTAQQPLRRSAQYHPTVWDPKVIESFTTHFSYDLHGRRLEGLKHKVAETLSRTSKERETSLILRLIDTMQRLGVAYHFEKEIKAALTSLVSVSLNFNTANDLHLVALQFRILREHCISTRADVFNKFRRENGRFKDSLSKDLEGLLGLYEASHLGMLGEDDVLAEAKSFSTKNLNQYLMGAFEDDNLSKQLVHQSLETPLHWRMARIEARNFIDIYQRDDPKNVDLLELAKLDYNLVQSVHQREIKELSRWWRDLDFRNKVSFSRDRLVENYLWAIGLVYEPHYSECRIGLTKSVCILTAIDDMYDVYGFLDELEQFTDAVHQWNVQGMQDLPEYMKPLYNAMLEFGNELAHNLSKNTGFESLDILPYVKKEWVKLCESYLVEARWFYSGYIPTLEEYLENSRTSVGGPGATQLAYLFLAIPQTKTSLESFKHGPQIIYWSSLITRLTDDLGTSKAESERGDVAKAVGCYTEEKGVSEEEAQRYINDLICYSWKKMNEESVKTSIPKSIVKMALNMARTAHSIFQHGDGIGTSIGVTKDRLISLIANPIPIYTTYNK